jgi:SNF2 family DNA or RNA helicase
MDGGLFLWAETADAPQPSRDRRKKSAQPHPFCAGTRELRELLEQIGWFGTHKADITTFQLPTGQFGPLPSPELIHDWELEDDPPELMPWTVAGFHLEPYMALLFLSHLHHQELPPKIHLGADGRFWKTAFAFLLQIMARQLLRPALVELRHGKETVYQARWQPLLDGDDEARQAAHLAAAMPPVCRAETKDPHQTIPPRAILDSFLNHLSDMAAREWTGKEMHYLPTDRDPAAAWLRALFANDPTIKAAPAQLQHFSAGFRAWERTLTIAGDHHYRVTFHLETPRKQEKETARKSKQQWRLHYLLQARDDPNLLVPAEEVWKTKGSVLNALERHFDRPKERLLTGLGYAARFFPPIQHSLERPNPTGIQLTTAEAYTFLRQCAPQLQQARFGLLVPPWWNKPGTRLGVRLKLGNKKLSGGAAVPSGHLSLDNLVQYQWQLSLGGTPLSREEFDALVALKSPLVQIRGQWVQLDPEQIEAAIQFWEKQKTKGTPEGTLSLHEAMRLGLDGEQQDYGGLDVEEVEMDDWLSGWLDRLQGEEQLEILPPPDGLEAQLRPYQHYGFSWLHFARRWGLGVILADDMGLGKTIQTLTLIQHLKEKGDNGPAPLNGGQLPAPILLICPTSVVTNWEQERRRFTPDIRALVHQGGDRLQDDDFLKAAAGVDMVMTSYALARRDGRFLQEINWFGVVLDEAQNIKNPNTKQAQIIRRLPTNFRLALTGTPVENRLSELWSIMHFLNPGYLGSRKQFREEFTLPIERYKDETAASHLRRLTRPFILRRVKTDPSVIQDLPDKQEMKVYCYLTPEQATLYEAVVKNVMGEIEIQAEDSMGRKGLILSMLTQLKQICNHPAHYLHETEAYNPTEDSNRSGKLQRLHDLLDEVLAEGDRLLLFSQFTEMAGLLKKYIQEQFGVPTLYLHGGLPAKKRAALVERFQSDDGPPVFILSLRAGGTGLNLTRANHVFHFDRWWNPAVEDQATDRAFRIGQTKNVLVHKFVCLGTLEERIDEMIQDKRALAGSIVGEGENWLTEMSTADLRELVRLRKE